MADNSEHESPEWLRTLEAGFIPAPDSGAKLTLCWGDDCPGDGTFSVPFGKGRACHAAVADCRCWQAQQRSRITPQHRRRT